MDKLIQEETNKYAKRFYETLEKDGYKLVEGYRYVTAHSDVEITHNECGRTYTTKPYRIIDGDRCRSCSYKNKNENKVKKHGEKFGLTLKNSGDSYAIGSSYKGMNEKVKLECDKGHPFVTTPWSYVKQSVRCGICNEGKQSVSSLESYSLHVEHLTEKEYSVIGDYVSSSIPILMKHNNESCGHREFTVTPNNFVSSESRCPSCNLSKGEAKIERFLSKNGYEYTKQEIFNECRDKKPLRFDFGVYEDGERLFMIEYQGEQHYKPVEHWGGEDNLKLIKKRDKIKNEYTKDNNIKLLHIPYWEFDEIDEILIKRLSQHT